MKKKSNYDIAVAGATGAVGRTMLSILEERKFPVGRLVPLASSRSAGTSLEFNGQKITVQELKEDSFFRPESFFLLNFNFRISLFPERNPEVGK